MLTVLGGVLLGIVLLVGALLGWLFLRTLLATQRTYAKLAARVAPVADALARGETPSVGELTRLAESRETRKVLLEALESAGRRDLFPARFLTWELLAEADLVAWLCHPNELGGAPDEIELVASVPAPGEAFSQSRYFVFRYRTQPPHWAAKDGWMAGVVGPCAIAEPPQPHARGTFSRFEPIDSRAPAEHVALVHEAVFGKAPTAAAG